MTCGNLSILILWIIIFSSCTSTSSQVSEEEWRSKSETGYLRMIGDIKPDSLIDNADFKLCSNENQLVQYYALNEKTYKGEKWAIEKRFSDQYKVPSMEGETGLIRIRFVVNCKGESGRFRIVGMNPDYSEKTFNDLITGSLLAVTRSLDGWKTFTRKSGSPLEYYQYLIFKIENGHLKEILP